MLPFNISQKLGKLNTKSWTIKDLLVRKTFNISNTVQSINASHITLITPKFFMSSSIFLGYKHLCANQVPEQGLCCKPTCNTKILLSST